MNPAPPRGRVANRLRAGRDCLRPTVPPDPGRRDTIEGMAGAPRPGRSTPRGPTLLMRLLFIGDIVGNPGVNFVRRAVPALIARERIDVVIANAENAANGSGLTA